MNVSPIVVAQILSAIAAVSTACAAIIAANGFDWKLIAPAVLMGVWGYLTKRPGDVSLKTHAVKVQAAYERGARESVRPEAMPEEEGE